MEREKESYLFSLKEDLQSVLRPHFDGCKHLTSLDFRDALPLGVSPLVLGNGHKMPSFAGDGGYTGLLSGVSAGFCCSFRKLAAGPPCVLWFPRAYSLHLFLESQKVPRGPRPLVDTRNSPLPLGLQEI